jgi:8-oxo-dGTP pyrophosphatase MutT (NUDIX family)
VSNRRRGAVVIVEDGCIAVIERELEGARWYLTPGGGIENGETVEEAAVREAKEEIGLDVELGAVVAKVCFARPDGGISDQVYFRATRVGGVFGPGSGGEYALPRDHPSGTYHPMWLDLQSIDGLDVRPRGLFEGVRDRGLDALEAEPLNLNWRHA